MGDPASFDAHGQSFNTKRQCGLTLQKERARLDEAWERQKIWLAAHWVSNGERIEPKEGKQPAFQLTIPFTEEAMIPLLAKAGKMDFFTAEKLSTRSTDSKAEAAKCAATKR